jgi:hypothetical protein
MTIRSSILCGMSSCLLHTTPIQENFIYKKQGPSPISLVRATRIFSKAKTLKKNLIRHWPSEIFQFICFEKLMDRQDKSEKKIGI